MPTIILKHKSPEFADQWSEGQAHPSCDMPGCPGEGMHKAPKHRGLDSYYHFCADHIRDYNSTWDFFSGMSEREVQDHMLRSFYGDRPTWRAHHDMEDRLYKAAQDTYHGGPDPSGEREQRGADASSYAGTPEYEAMAVMGLSPPVTLEEIKQQYKKLAKKYHPDLNRENSNAEELLKKINMAYTILKCAFEAYSDLEKRKA